MYVSNHSESSMFLRKSMRARIQSPRVWKINSDLNPWKLSEESRIRLGPFLENYTIGFFDASFFGTCSRSRLGARGSIEFGVNKYGQSPC